MLTVIDRNPATAVQEQLFRLCRVSANLANPSVNLLLCGIHSDNLSNRIVADRTRPLESIKWRAVKKTPVESRLQRLVGKNRRRNIDGRWIHGHLPRWSPHSKWIGCGSAIRPVGEELAHEKTRGNHRRTTGLRCGP
jgi:hypothetical protein